ncbi:MAG: ribosome small subunit-dependent GTPase A [Solirubrobacteraceae bacterium]|nr:ribosome small subunit-dependent GTPase A [Solirubrobacteraceae bacterium]
MRSDDDEVVRVLAQHTDRWLVGTDPPRLVAGRGRLKRTGSPVTGDWVRIDDGGAIAEIIERRGTITRRAAGETTAPQVLAANVDLALVMEALPDPNPRRAERFVTLASSGGVPSAIVLSKADRAPDDAHEQAVAIARDAGVVDGLAVAAPTGDGVQAVRALLTPGTTTVLMGASGAGKSTLANALLGEDRQAIGEVRAEDDRGRHTTVTRELLELPNGALLIDTPGIREIGLWDGTGETFADIDELALQCRFADCQHEGQPGCAVEAATDPERIAAWRKLAAEQQWIDDRKAAAREREARGRSYARVQVEARRTKGNDDLDA